MKIESLFQTQLSDLLDGTRQLEAALPHLIQATDWAPLRLTLLQHQDLTRKHGKRLETILANLGIPLLGRKCKVVREVVDEIFTMLPALPEAVGMRSAAARSAFPCRPFTEERVVALLQKAGNYKTAGFSTLSVWAEIIEMAEVRRPLALSLQESRAMQHWLGNLAAQYANPFLPNIIDFPAPAERSLQPLTVG